ncbi:MAG TPA: hypothetical protein VNG04_05390 [Candidatus Acidoferrum sp.]|nr:hypothetical protein [Candidatus Acidoferrum sp.]
MSRLPLPLDRVGHLAEASLHLVGEERVLLDQEARLLGFLDGLDEADALELAQAKGHAKTAAAMLAEVQRRCEQKREIRERMRALIVEGEAFQNEAAREVSTIATAAGFVHARPELVDCSPTEKATV